jgi:hypothetical protein
MTYLFQSFSATKSTLGGKKNQDININFLEGTDEKYTSHVCVYALVFIILN